MFKKTPVIFTKSVDGKKGCTLPKLDVPKCDLKKNIPTKYIRTKLANLPELSEPEIVRHFVNLSSKNHHVDKDMYPLGSCTMKYNPKINEWIASLDEFLSSHPHQSIKDVQLPLMIMHELEIMLTKITGMKAFTLQPSAGSQGEFVGLLIMQKYHELKKNKKKYILIPESAHGTNPASVVLAGYEPISILTNKRGRVDMKDLRDKLNNEVAGMMLTQPNTLGLFEDDILTISSLIHKVDGLMYMDGANLNALIGLSKSIDMGFDIVHINLHKTFSTPHGGGGPGAGPIGVKETLEDYLPYPMVRKKKDRYLLDYHMPNSIGRVHAYYGNFGILVRAYVYIKMLGEEGVKKMTKFSILNANYLKELLKDDYFIPYPNGTMHEFVISAIKQKDKGAKALDIAKSLLDYGFHAPTIYFPTNVPESMMIEPTESENKETLDRFIKAMIEINNNIHNNLDIIKDSPSYTPVGRLDETKANRELDVRWKHEV